MILVQIREWERLVLTVVSTTGIKRQPRKRERKRIKAMLLLARHEPQLREVFFTRRNRREWKREPSVGVTLAQELGKKWLLSQRINRKPKARQSGTPFKASLGDDLSLVTLDAKDVPREVHHVALALLFLVYGIGLLWRFIRGEAAYSTWFFSISYIIIIFLSRT